MTNFKNTSVISKVIDNNQFICSVEINPPVGTFDLQNIIDTTNKLHQAGIDTINIADGPRALIRMSNWAMGQIIKQETNINPMLHVCCRDKSFLGLQSHILGLHALGFRDLVIITGDPPNLGLYPNSTGVFDLNSIQLLKTIKNYNLGFDPSGKEMPKTNFKCATGVEPAADNYALEIERLKLKKEAGADIVLTQPIYDYDRLYQFLQDAKTIGIPVMLGLCPLVNHKNAMFLTQKIRGMSVPQNILERMLKAEHDNHARQEGITIAREILSEFKSQIQGVYIMPQLGHYDMALDILKDFI